MVDLNKTSQTTRKLAAESESAYALYVSNLKVRFVQAGQDDTLLALVREDALIGAISQSIYARTPPKERKARVDYEQDAIILMGKKGFGATGDGVRTKLEDDMFKACLKRFNRARSDAGFPSQEARGGKRAPQVTKANEPKPTTTVSDTLPSNEPTPTFNVSIAKPKTGHDLGSAIKTLVVTASKLMNEASQTKVLDGEAGLIARDALKAIIEAGRRYDARCTALELAREAAKPDAAPGARRAAAIAAVKAHPCVIEEIHIATH